MLRTRWTDIGLLCLALPACGADHLSSEPVPDSVAVSLDGAPFRVDTAALSLGTNDEFALLVEQHPTSISRRNISVWVRSPTGPGDYRLSDFVQGDGAAWYQDDSNTAVMGFTGFRPAVTLPGRFTITSWDRIGRSMSADFDFPARQYVPAGSDSLVHVTGSFRLHYTVDSF